MRKDLLIALFSVVLISGAIFLSGLVNEPGKASLSDSYEPAEVEDEMVELIDCLAENGLVIYGAKWCEACNKLIEPFGGYEIAQPIYVECSNSDGTQEEVERCQSETKTEYVPEIQIKGELYEGSNYPQDFARELGCEYDPK